MIELKERQDIAKAMNFGEYPILKLDISDADEYGIKGCPCKIDMGTFNDGSRFLQKAELRFYCDEKSPTFSSGGACLSNVYNYTDFMNDYTAAISPTIKPNSEFVLIIMDSIAKTIYKVMIVKTFDTHKFSIRPIDMEAIDLSNYLKLSVLKYNKFQVQ